MPERISDEYSTLKTQIEKLQTDLDEVKKMERAAALKQVKEICEEFGFTARMLGKSLAEGRNRKAKKQQS